MTLRLNWFSNAPWTATGYGVQTKLFAPRIHALGYPISITAYYGLQGGLAKYGDIPVFPNGFHPYGQDIIGAAAHQDKSDAVITLTDAWVIEPQGIGLPWFPWFPVDCEPMPPAVVEKVKFATRGIVMSKFGAEQAANIGMEVEYVPLGVDTNVYRRVEGARERLGWPADKFIVGFVASNKTLRKSQLEQIAAFAVLHKQHPDTMLYLHMADGTRGIDAADLAQYARMLGLRVGWISGPGLIPDIDVLFVNQYDHLLGLPDMYMVDVYNALDVLTSASMGEGFGIPIVEAQACGCPVIVGDWTSMGELCGSGWKIGKEEARVTYDPGFSSFRWSVSVECVLERYLAAYDMRGNNDYRESARAFSLQYDADKITEKYWKPTLTKLESLLQEQNTSNLAPNLALLRMAEA